MEFSSTETESLIIKMRFQGSNEYKKISQWLNSDYSKLQGKKKGTSLS